ncbi:MAG: BREX system P-loop protein BrxC [Halanaerobiales bacterium]|nr:BREX system P-loop protein BrxC [Halanaerobiales bacterium]
MQLKKMFVKDIERDIKGVIKIGQEDDRNVYHELDEYIVTRELSRHFGDFFESYRRGNNDYTDKMGVWISGFFGSGKSHFLKILSYLLDNKNVQGKQAVEYFDGKIKDPAMLADMMRAGKINTDVILFNIDSKSDSDSKNNKDAIVKVFNKVFDEMQGFCGSIPWLADLERQLVKDGTYEGFKAKFKEVSGSSWEEAREDIYFEGDSVIEALVSTTKMSEESARVWYEKAEDNYSLSIEKFAKRVNEYIESKGNNHHVVFLVDEIGQYIGDSVQLMLNLQTVVEDLGTFCGGRAWVIVTSQQDIDSITKVKGNNFSKIQGRFNTRLNLSSANVDEVIKKRILEKNQTAVDTLKMFYDDKEAILKNLITFSSDTAEMKRYKSVEDFVEVYPFIPYQFNLLQSVFTGIRLHGASGKHLSEGERSLLSAFQESAIQFVNEEVGVIVPFNAFYRTIEAFLDSNIRMVILHAEDNDNLEAFDVEVLIVLFMIKYVKELPSNIENIATLMVSHIDEDKINLKKKIENSLKRLLKETLIQKNGNEYIFLTNEEQDVNKEIQAIPIEMGEVIQKISEEIFDGIFSDIKKYRYSLRYHFDYNKIIDDRFYSGQKHDIGLKIITPYFDSGEELNDQSLKLMSFRENNLILKMPMDTAYLEEMKDVLQIQTYLTRKGSSGIPEIEEIKARKQREINERKRRITDLLHENLKHAEIYSNSQKLDIKPKLPVERINVGFKYMIDNRYNKLAYINTPVDSIKDLVNIINADKSQLTIIDREQPNDLAVAEIDGFITRNTERHIPTTMKSIMDIYSKAPYGWLDMDIVGIVLRIFTAQEITLEMANEYLKINDPDLIKYLTKRDYVDRVLIKKRTKISPVLINNAKEIAKELFNYTAMSADEDGLMTRFKEFSEIELSTIRELLVNYKHLKYPGYQVMKVGQGLFTEIIKIKDVKVFFDILKDKKDDYLDYEEDVYDVKKFFDGEQVEYFNKALKQLNIYSKNESYVLDQETIMLINSIKSIVENKNPYNQISKLPNLIDEFISKFVDLLVKECEPIRTVIVNDKKKVLDEIEQFDFKDELKPEFKKQFEALLDRLDSANNFYEAIAMKEESDRFKQRCFEKIERVKQEKALEKAREKQPKGTKEPEPPVYRTKKIKHVSVANILHGVKLIETKEDIEDFLNHMREVLEKQIDEDSKIKLI